jgi:hypothetical protein
MEAEVTKAAQTPEVVETPKAAKASKKAKAPKKTEVDMRVGIRCHLGSTDFQTKYPEVVALMNRMATSGCQDFKFDFGMSHLEKPSKRIVVEAKYNAPADWPGSQAKLPAAKKGSKTPAQFTKGTDYSATSRAFAKDIPEFGKLLERLTKAGFGMYRLNFSWATQERPSKRIETKIWQNAKPDWK